MTTQALTLASQAGLLRALPRVDRETADSLRQRQQSLGAPAQAEGGSRDPARDPGGPPEPRAGVPLSAN